MTKSQNTYRVRLDSAERAAGYRLYFYREFMKYNALRNYKKFKKQYLHFVLFISHGQYYYTYDSDARIMMYLYKSYREPMSFRISKERFPEVLRLLLSNNLNVVVAGWKNAREYYTDKESKYLDLKKKGKLTHREYLKNLH